MGSNLTAGFDALFEISQSEINEQLDMSHSEGGQLISFPPGHSGSFNAQGYEISYTLNFGAPQINILPERLRVTLIIPFYKSTLEISTIPNFELMSLAGEIILTTTITIESGASSNNRSYSRIAIDFNDPNLIVDFSITNPPNYSDLLSILNISKDDFDELIKESIISFLRNEVGYIYVGSEIPINNKVLLDEGPEDEDDDNNYRIDGVYNKVDITTLSNVNPDKSSIIVGADYRANNASDLTNINQSFLTENDTSLIVVGNSFTYFSIKIALARRFEIPISLIPDYFEDPCTLIKEIKNQNINGHIVDFRSLQITIEDEKVLIKGKLFTKKGPANVNISFYFYAMLEIEAENIVVKNTEPVIDVNVDLEWWVWLSTIGLGAIVGNVAGAIVAPVVLALLESLAFDNLVELFLGNEISTDSLNLNVTFPIGPVSDFKVPERITIDDIVYRNVIKHKSTLTINNRNSIDVNGNWKLDLDQGKFFDEFYTDDNVDLAYDKSIGLRFINRCKFRTFSKHFEDVDAYDIYKLNKNRTFISFFNIPLMNPSSLDFKPMTLGVVTNEGRLCKLSLMRNDSFNLMLQWVVYNNPVPSLTTKVNWIPLTVSDEYSITFKKDIDGFLSCNQSEASFKCEINFWTNLMKFPIRIKWIINGIHLSDENGHFLDNNGNDIKYKYNSKKFILYTSVGQKVELEIDLEVENDDGQKVTKTILLLQNGYHTFKCNRIGKTFIPKPNYFIKEVDPRIYLANPVSSLSDIFINKVNELLT